MCPAEKGGWRFFGEAFGWRFIIHSRSPSNPSQPLITHHPISQPEQLETVAQLHTESLKLIILDVLHVARPFSYAKSTEVSTVVRQLQLERLVDLDDGGPALRALPV